MSARKGPLLQREINKANALAYIVGEIMQAEGEARKCGSHLYGCPCCDAAYERIRAAMSKVSIAPGRIHEAVAAMKEARREDV